MFFVSTLETQSHGESNARQPFTFFPRHASVDDRGVIRGAAQVAQCKLPICIRCATVKQATAAVQLGRAEGEHGAHWPTVQAWQHVTRALHGMHGRMQWYGPRVEIERTEQRLEQGETQTIRSGVLALAALSCNGRLHLQSPTTLPATHAQQRAQRTRTGNQSTPSAIIHRPPAAAAPDTTCVASRRQHWIDRPAHSALTLPPPSRPGTRLKAHRHLARRPPTARPRTQHHSHSPRAFAPGQLD